MRRVGFTFNTKTGEKPFFLFQMFVLYVMNIFFVCGGGLSLSDWSPEKINPSSDLANLNLIAGFFLKKQARKLTFSRIQPQKILNFRRKTKKFT